MHPPQNRRQLSKLGIGTPQAWTNPMNHLTCWQSDHVPGLRKEGAHSAGQAGLGRQTDEALKAAQLSWCSGECSLVMLV